MIGTGPIAQLFADAVREVDGVHLSVVYSRDSERGAFAADRLGASGSVTSLAALLESDVVDAVYIASPNAVHADQVRNAIDAGKHVLVEKPAVDTAARWRQFVELAAERNVVLLEAMRTAYDPGTALLKELLPQVGPIRQVTLRHISRSARYDLVLAGDQVNIFDPEMGGGALRDLGVYCVHAMTSLFGMPRRISGTSVIVRSGADGAGVALATYDGFVVSLEYSKITTSRVPSQISGEAGTLSIDHIASPRLIEFERHDDEVARHVVSAPQHTLVGEVERFVRLVTDGADATLDQQSTDICLGVMEAIEWSAQAGRTFTIT
ncbi:MULTISPECIES: Gfo/Idh/MocA family oxidoreductase [unclassified Microbacterium]|uniref:Gfo/Idh/MocA family protein n=1 Tax=unclassified Microbacterium TaxID=2609290 RepID=UPI00214A9B1E|nr:MULTISPECIES: Gfo/Idh/MocA family oxidoreductase [unclassified Microbacterium]MCR2811126.1 Gfo/Idh/MocA family oxidoreductase [Microbacterium sp. zg.B185]WIM20760.1 Gfo/Idh/MocA family oxidoreductase [Microbacterium sp. zg-B185]